MDEEIIIYYDEYICIYIDLIYIYRFNLDDNLP